MLYLDEKLRAILDHIPLMEMAFLKSLKDNNLIPKRVSPMAKRPQLLFLTGLAVRAVFHTLD